MHMQYYYKCDWQLARGNHPLLPKEIQVTITSYSCRTSADKVPYSRILHLAIVPVMYAAIAPLAYGLTLTTAQAIIRPFKMYAINYKLRALVSCGQHLMSTLQQKNNKKCPGYHVNGGQAREDSQVLDIELRNQNTSPQTSVSTYTRSSSLSSPNTNRISILRLRQTITDDIVPEDIAYERQVGVLYQIHALHALFGQPLMHWQDINACIADSRITTHSYSTAGTALAPMATVMMPSTYT